MTTIDEVKRNLLDEMLLEKQEQEKQTKMFSNGNPNRYRISLITDGGSLTVLSSKPTYREAKAFALEYAEKRKLGIVHIAYEVPLFYMLTVYISESRYQIAVYKER